MKTLIVYSSISQGNTEKVARTIAEILEARLLKPHQFDVNVLEEYDLIGFGSGIYFEKYHRSLLDLSVKLPEVNGKKAFIFSTSGWGNTKYNESFMKILTQKGFDIIGNFACKGFDKYGFVKHFGGVNKGRPNEDDLKEAENFANDMKK